MMQTCRFFMLQNLAGTIVSLINIMSITMSPNARTAAIYYFITALFILLASFDTYFALPLNVSEAIPHLYPKVITNDHVFTCCEFAAVLPVSRTRAQQKHPREEKNPDRGCVGRSGRRCSERQSGQANTYFNV